MISTIYKEMAERYSERKNKRHTHFKKFYKQPEDLPTALANPPDFCTADTWRDICQLFLSERFQNRSTKNKDNRKKMKYPTTQGTKSLAAKRHEYVSYPVFLNFIIFLS